GNDNLKLCDFGLSLVVKCRVRDGQEELDRCRYFGSPPFFPSPELRNGGFPTRCADIWSAGCVLYQMLTLLSESRVLAKCREQRFDFNMSASTATTETIDLLDLMLQVNPQNRSKTGDAVKASDQFLRFLHE
uniref:Protein kinase domain-containing protein n=1 Tax=Plectus sambesii TaxID=2011161 RepID=A0A914V4M9_9BILA